MLRMTLLNGPGSRLATCIAFSLLAIMLTGASRRTANFVVTAPTRSSADTIASAAESLRLQLALDWLGSELPVWRRPCVIDVQMSSQLATDGSTTFLIKHGTATDWRMSVQGSRERILDSVLPHEIAHTVFATHFGCPLPRWLEEGVCVMAEHSVSQAELEDALLEAVIQGRGMKLERLVVVQEYPADAQPFYAQGYSVTKFLIERGGKERLIDFITDGVRRNNWPRAIKNHYGFSHLSDLHQAWLRWVLPDGVPQKDGLSTDPAQPTTPDGTVMNTGDTSL